MLFFLLGLVCLALSLASFMLLRTYGLVPPREVKRKARKGDELAQTLYKAAAYGTNLRAFLKSIMIVFAVLSVASLTRAFDFWLAIFIDGIVSVVVIMVFVPSNELTHSSLWLAKTTAPALAWILSRLQPVLDYAVRFAAQHHPVTVHTGLYEKSDLSDLLVRQKGQPDSRITDEEIDLLTHTLSFGDKLVADCLTPKRVVKSVERSTDIGPILMQDLHTSGHSRFPVYDSSTDNIVGILYLRNLVTRKQTGTVADVMSTKLTYVHEDFTLHQTLQAFIKTKQHLFIVVNSFEELVGIITVEDILEQMIGKAIVDEFDQYEDLRAVAAAAAKKDHAAHNEPKAELVEATAEPPEVVK